VKHLDEMQKVVKDNLDVSAKTLVAVSKDAKASYERFVTETTKIGELCANLVKETYKSFENNLSKATSTR